VSVEKEGLESEVKRLKEEIKTLEDTNKMQMSQVNALLIEKIDLQSEGIGARERMLAKEREYGFVL
jgi:protein HOOK3